MQKSNILGKRLFSFAVIADSHLNQDEVDCNSPFPVNKLANLRMRHVVRDLNRRDIDFIVHLGDLIHPVPAVKDLYAQAAQRFYAQVKELAAPLYLTPGNHDIGDKPMPWAPAGAITEAYVQLWTDTFGKHFYSFDRQGIHFVVINAQLMNSGLPSELEQKHWLERDFKAHAGKRIFVCTHYPPFLCQPDEAEHYDNMAEPERGWLLRLMAEAGVEGLFAGHVHNFWYLKEQGTRHYLLPSTAFVRQDFSEMFKAPPALEEAEAGRNDAAKLGYFLVHLHEHGHVCQMVRTGGACVAADDAPETMPERVMPVSPLQNRYASLGFDLRQSWAEKIGIPPSGALDEFDRKEVRNDYPLLALWEMGIRHLRIPLQDLRNAQTRRRMRDLVGQGQTFTLFSYGLPSLHDERCICENADLLHGWEIGFRWQELTEMADGLRSLRQGLKLPIYLARMWEHEDNKAPDGRYYHVINHGFTVNDAARIRQIAELPNLGPTGVVLRVMRHENLRACTAFAHDTHLALGIPVSVHLRLAGFNPAKPVCDDAWTARRTAEALFCSAGKGVTTFADTLTDIDRGYFVRNGVLDQVCNPRLAAHVIGNLAAALHEGTGEIDPTGEKDAHGRWLFATQGNATIALFLPAESSVGSPLAVPPGIFPDPQQARIIDLESGFAFPNAEAAPPLSSQKIYFLRQCGEAPTHGADQPVCTVGESSTTPVTISRSRP